jgi:hypothetical protein
MTARAGNSVIEFPRDRVRPTAPREPSGCSAEVVIFTGVRIERLPDDDGCATQAQSRLSRKNRGGRR